MHKTILVTGATGTVGREVVKQLSMLDDIRVRAGVHSLIKGENLRRLPDVEVVEMEFENPESLHAAFTHADKVFMITPFAYDQVEQARILVDEAKRADVQHIVRLSASGADAEPGIQLGRWHREIERDIEQSGISYTHLRPTSFMQNFVNYCAESIKQEGKFYMPVGDGKVSYVDVRDVAAVGVEALIGNGHEGQAYEISGPEALSHTEIADIFSQVLKTDIQYVDVPEHTALQSMLSQSMPEWMANAMLELYGVYKSGYGCHVTDTVQRVVGRPARSFLHFVQDYNHCFVESKL
ncbi:SDR family oxidoreductase [Pontibacter vulgaris]|uniref:SDR family oxidoreductase n=1 Tax=Pontibacter vulgaris TaxID=2905679 RepID=UPI001FA7E62F|nr:SDR family oxidoreductase [Pontibacter vulgaris]